MFPFGLEILLFRTRAHAFKAKRSSEWHFTGVYQMTQFPRVVLVTSTFDFPACDFQSYASTGLPWTTREVIAPEQRCDSDWMGNPSFEASRTCLHAQRFQGRAVYWGIPNHIVSQRNAYYPCICRPPCDF